MRRARNTYQNGWIETRPSNKHDLVFVYRWRERKPDGGYSKRAEVIGPVSMLKTEANAWRAIEHRKLEVNSDGSQGSAVTVGILVNRYLEMELPELRHSTANEYRSYLQSPDQTAVGRVSDFEGKALRRRGVAEGPRSGFEN